MSNILSTISEQETIPGFDELDDDISTEPDANEFEQEQGTMGPGSSEAIDQLNESDGLFEGLGEAHQNMAVDDASVPEVPEHVDLDDGLEDLIAEENVDTAGEALPFLEPEVAELGGEADSASNPDPDAVPRMAAQARQRLSDMLAGIEQSPEEEQAPDPASLAGSVGGKRAPGGSARGSGFALSAIAAKLGEGINNFRRDPQVRLAQRYAASVDVLNQKIQLAESVAWELAESPLGKQREVLKNGGITPKPEHFNFIMENNKELPELIQRYEDSVTAVGNQAKKVISNGKSAGMNSAELSQSIGAQMDDFNDRMKKAVEDLFGSKGKKLFEAVENVMSSISSFVSALFQRLRGGAKNA